MRKRNLWNELRDFFHSKEKGSLIRRRQLLEKFGKSSNRGYQTFDGYRNILRAAGFLSTYKPGIYRIEKKIPKDLTLNELNNIAYKEKWKQWFLKEEE